MPKGQDGSCVEAVPGRVVHGPSRAGQRVPPEPQPEPQPRSSHWGHRAGHLAGGALRSSPGAPVSCSWPGPGAPTGRLAVAAQLGDWLPRPLRLTFGSGPRAPKLAGGRQSGRLGGRAGSLLPATHASPHAVTALQTSQSWLAHSPTPTSCLASLPPAPCLPSPPARVSRLCPAAGWLLRPWAALDHPCTHTHTHPDCARARTPQQPGQGGDFQSSVPAWWAPSLLLPLPPPHFYVRLQLLTSASRYSRGTAKVEEGWEGKAREFGGAGQGKPTGVPRTSKVLPLCQRRPRVGPGIGGGMPCLPWQKSSVGTGVAGRK